MAFSRASSPLRRRPCCPLPRRACPSSSSRALFLPCRSAEDVCTCDPRYCCCCILSRFSEEVKGLAWAGRKNSPLVEVNVRLLADDVGEPSADTLDLGEGVHHLVLAVHIGVKQTVRGREGKVARTVSNRPCTEGKRSALGVRTAECARIARRGPGERATWWAM